eukprot:TRINITY_DN3480_c0_g1_i4.p1 TRINITY_DN3480_c0_g1~~TRINITY_DN3480_c0_g1_i4.p1  ORF type:complete len:735 (+),score=230.75 TRINITY_DN3480_c0_g1_i4:44-2248(+)
MQYLSALRSTKRFALGSTGIWGSARRMFSTAEAAFKKIRNIGISAHIDSGKTTFTERLLFYSGRIGDIHEVKGSDNVGATMDFMELEREKGITIQSAATHIKWKENFINVIDTPGHVDFTIEVERALRVLDGAVLIICGASGVQPQTLTVDKQMKRYEVPRVIFVNKLDRMGANPWAAIDGARSRLSLNCAAVQIPIGLEGNLKGIVDLITMKAYYNEGPKGETLREDVVPDNLKAEAETRRQELIDILANVDPAIEDAYLSEKPVDEALLKAAIRRQTIARKFIPVFMGSAYKNKGVQLAMDGICEYLPAPDEKENHAHDMTTNAKIKLEINSKKPFVGFAFKLEENRFGQLTYIRVYQGKLKKGDYVYNATVKKRMKVSRMVKMHANTMEDISEVEAGDIFALFGVECATGDTFAEGDMNTLVSLTPIFVPDPVMSLSIRPTKNEFGAKFQKALNKFRREDPTFHVNVDPESEEIIISGMGELHLQIYAERMRREFGIDVTLGQPSVNYREVINQRADFDYLHKKQSGGAGQYARVAGYLEPIDTETVEFSNTFENKIVGTAIPNEFIPAIEKAFYETVKKGPLTGYPVVNCRYVLCDGSTHVVDSSSTAFAIATKYSFTQGFRSAAPGLLEPLMIVEVTVPQTAYTSVMGGISKRRGLITNTEGRGDMFIITATVPLSMMFGYATELRGLTAGQGEYSMEYLSHQAVPPGDLPGIIERYQKKLRAKKSSDN